MPLWFFEFLIDTLGHHNYNIADRSIKFEWKKTKSEGRTYYESLQGYEPGRTPITESKP